MHSIGRRRINGDENQESSVHRRLTDGKRGRSDLLETTWSGRHVGFVTVSASREGFDMFTNNWYSMTPFSDLKMEKRVTFPIRPAGLQVRAGLARLPSRLAARRSSSQINSDLCDMNKYHLYRI